MARLHKDRLLLFGIFACLVGIRVLRLGLGLLVITLLVLPLILFVLLALVPERFFVSGLFRYFLFLLLIAFFLGAFTSHRSHLQI